MESETRHSLVPLAKLVWYSLLNLVMAFAYIAFYVLLQLGLYLVAVAVERRIGAMPPYGCLPVMVIQAMFAIGTLALFGKFLLRTINDSLLFSPSDEETE